jgi:hemerythrin-like metal-binding protein
MAEAQMGSAWKKQMSVGNGIIDSEHRNLLNMAADIESMIQKRDACTIARELEQFETWLRAHFENEEGIALSVDFDVTPNRLEHQNLLKAFQLMKGALTSGGDTFPDSTARHYYAHFLSDWLEDHITEEDMLMKPVLQTRPYDFIPDHMME